MEGDQPAVVDEQATALFHAVSRPLHTGRRIVVVGTDILDDDGKLAARVTQSQAVL